MRKRARVGDIVVIMQPCYRDCQTCANFIGATALVTAVYVGCNEVTLQFADRELRRDPVTRGGFFVRDLYITGLSA